MSMDVSGISIANEIAVMVRQMSQEAEHDSRETARSEAKAELALGLDQAEHMHQAAADMRLGAILGGATLVAAGVAEGLCINSLAKASGGKVQVAQDKFELAKQSGEMSSYINHAFEAAAKNEEAFGQADGARARAAGHVVDEANDAVRAAREQSSSVTETYKEILRAKHDSIMATLASRG